MRAEETALVDWVFDHEPELAKAVLHAIFAKYPELQARYGYDDAEAKRVMPSVSAPGDLRNLIGLHSLYVHQVQTGPLPYVGFEFGCTWDEEHGLGVLMHGTRPVEVGGSDTAFLLWLAEQDAESN